MTRITVDIDNQSNAKVLATFLRSLGYVKSVSVAKPVKPLTEEDWILPGRPAGNDEIEQLLDAMDKDTDEGITTEQLEKEIAQWNKGIYK